ncbi:unnamed protein product, partial [Brenthis ino]
MESVKAANDSPKTPGGISKSYLTPIRRVGLSRNWRKSGPSPFISPLSTSSNSPVATNTEKLSRKRKIIPSDDDSQQNIADQDSISGKGITFSPLSCNTLTASDISRTPTRNLLVNKKSKTLVLNNEIIEEPISEEIKVINNTINDCNEFKANKECPKSSDVKVSKLSRTSSKNKSKIHKPDLDVENKETTKNDVCINEDKNINEKARQESNDVKNINKECDTKKQKSPNDLTKECVVLIQKKIFKSLNVNKNKTEVNEKLKSNVDNPFSQVLFDSDSDDVPLCNFNDKGKIKTGNTKCLPINDEDDFQETKIDIKKLVNKTTSTSELKHSKTKEKNKISKTTKPPIKIENTPSSQSSASFDDDDDFQFEKKKTILVKKSYDKVTKPLKAKSTGSITQKDIEEIKHRIEKKKQLLLAKAMTHETSELRMLIKKWQKGCQNALTELLELMKKKMPDKENMEYSEILQILKIPPDLVGYDSENDCFVTPDDATIVLSEFNV